MVTTFILINHQYHQLTKLGLFFTIALYILYTNSFILSRGDMPLIKKLIRLGKSSRAVIIPAEWLEYYEKQGINIESILMELDGEIVMRIPTEAEGKLIDAEREDKIADQPKGGS